jgi:hypothetical protein
MTMPQTDTQRTGRRAAADALPPRAAGRGLSQGELETEDHVYGLVSVLYHALQGADTYERYIDDAERAGDDELVQFFEQCRDQEHERATRAKRLLGDRNEDEAETEDDEDMEDESSDGDR